MIPLFAVHNDDIRWFILDTLSNALLFLNNQAENKRESPETLVFEALHEAIS